MIGAGRILLAAIGAFVLAVAADATATPPGAAPDAAPATAPVEAPGAGAPPAAAAKPEIIAQRNVRIGLTTDSVRARVTADGGVLVRDPVRKTLIWKKVFTPGVSFVAEVQGHGPLLVYRVQIGSYATREAAEEKQRAVEALLPAEKVVVAWNPDRKAWRVRAGEFRSRDEAATLSQRLADEGYREIWIVEEEAEAGGKRRVRLVDDRWHDFQTGGDRVLVSPAKSGAWLKIDQASYRGTLEVRVDRGGRLRIINELPMEDYLRGVVPNEMGPGVYPELEALKAQAVAARTYIVANLGQFSENGYDICDSPACQVYKGASTEHPLTNQALDETRGLVLIWQGKPINARYTSTCGGHTEEGDLIFPDENEPYLKGVPCYPEVAGEARTLEGGSWVEPVVVEDGAQANEEIQLVRLHGLVGKEALEARWLAAPCSASDAERWIGAALKLAGKNADPAGLAGNRLDLANLAEYLGRSLGWQEKMRLGLDDRDLPYLLAFRDRDEIPENARRPYALLVIEGILDPFPDNSLRPKHVPSRGLMLRTLYRLLDYYQVFEREPATYRGSDGARLILESKKDARVLAVRPDVALFRSFRDVSYPARSVPLTLGDRVLYHAGDDGMVDYLRVNANSRGVSDDRYSSLYRWEERRTRDELEALVRQRVDVGTLVDVEPTRRGVSGRVVEVRLIGSRGEFMIRGFRIRTAFGLRENLFTIDRTRGADGKVKSFIFSGKGWGHGLGLCQVGAYGMALRGKRFDEILRHYYTGAELLDTTRPDASPAAGR